MSKSALADLSASIDAVIFTFTLLTIQVKEKGIFTTCQCIIPQRKEKNVRNKA